MITVRMDEDTVIDLLVNRVKYWTDDDDTIELFEQYYTSMVEGGCFDGADLDIMSIVDNDYVNNTSIVTREEFEKDRDEYIQEQMKSDGFMDEEVSEEEREEALKEYEEDTPTWEDLERGEHNLEFLSGYYIEAKTSESLLLS